MTDLRDLSKYEILGLTIIGEARGETIEGQVGVGCVVRNRLHSNPTKYKTYHDVVLEPFQFSCWDEKDPNRPFLLEIASDMTRANENYLRQCMWVAQGVIDWIVVDNTIGAMYYMTKKLFYSSARPKWASRPVKMVERNNHTFFSLS